jgi:hypothetical protein
VAECLCTPDASGVWHAVTIPPGSVVLTAEQAAWALMCARVTNVQALTEIARDASRHLIALLAKEDAA